MRRFLPGVIVLLAFPAIPQSTTGQNAIHFERISSNHGLSQNSVFSIAQDHLGFMWFSTQDGVNRYDGHSFLVFRQNLSDSNSLSNNFCGPLLVDRQGRIWIGTEGSGVDMLDPNTVTFRNYHRQNETLSRTGGDAIKALAEDADGRIWVGTQSGLGIINPAPSAPPVIRDVPGIPEKIVGALLRDRNDALWVGTELGAFVSEGDGGGFRRISFDDAGSRHVQGLAEDEGGVVWATTSRGLYRLDPVRSAFQPAHPFFTGRDLGAIIPGNGDALWICSVVGLIEYHPAREALQIHSHSDIHPTSLSSNAVISAYKDRSGVLWFGTFSGVNRYAPLQTKFLTYRHIPGDPASLSNGNVRSVCEDHTGALWISTLNGLNRLSPGQRSFRRYYPSTSGLSSNLVWSIREQRLGDRSVLWAGTNAHGVNEILIAPDGKAAFRHHLKGRSIASMAIDSGGVIWAGDLNGEVYRFDRRAKEFTIAPIKNAERVVALHVDRNNDLWIGTLGNGAIRLRSSTGEIRSYRHDPSRPGSLSNNHVISFCEDQTGAMWIGTYAGLNRLDPTGASFSRYTTREGLPNDVVYGILCDDLGNLWMSTNMGIARLNPATSRFVSFDVSDGLQDNEFNQGAAYKARNGMMYFGGINGISVFHPDSISLNPHVPSVVITDFRVLHKSIRSDMSTIRFKGPIEHAKSITLSHRENVFSVEFVALEFTNPRKNRYSYKMEGFDDRWIEAGDRREATYTNLDPGSYVFRVRASNNDGVWNEEGAALSIIITPPFWMTWWFRGILVLGFLSVGPFIYFRRVRSLRREHKMQEELSRKLIDSQEAERKRIAGELHDSVGQDLLVIRNKLILGLEAGGGTPEQRREFAEAADYAAKSLKHVREISRNLRPLQLDQLGLSAAIESVVEAVTKAGQLDHSLHIDDIAGFLSKETEIHVFRIIQEALNNVVKHAGKCTVSVEVKRLETGVVIQIADNGAGFDPAAASRSQGLGLSGISERAKIAGGEAVISSAPGAGTKLTVTVPLKSHG